MKKLISMLLALVMLFALAACGDSAAPAESAAPSGSAAPEESPAAETADVSKDPVVNLSFGGTFAADDLATQAMERIAANAKEQSGGTIIISVFPASQLGDAVAQIESMIGGAEDMVIEAQGSYMQQYGIMEAAVNSFGLVYSQELLSKELQSDFWAGLEAKFLESTGVRTLANNFVRQPTVIASKTPLRSIEDFKGVKLRTVSSQVTMDVYNSLGFSTTPVAFNEVYLSLQQGVIDATIASLDQQYTLGFYENAPYITMWGNSCTNIAVWINDAKFQSMTPAQQEILLNCCKEAGDWYCEQSNAVVGDYMKAMEEAGAEFIYLDEATTAEMNSKIAEVAEKYEAEGKWPAGTYAELEAIVG